MPNARANSRQKKQDEPIHSNTRVRVKRGEDRRLTRDGKDRNNARQNRWFQHEYWIRLDVAKSVKRNGSDARVHEHAFSQEIVHGCYSMEGCNGRPCVARNMTGARRTKCRPDKTDPESDALWQLRCPYAAPVPLRPAIVALLPKTGELSSCRNATINTSVG